MRVLEAKCKFVISIVGSNGIFQAMLTFILLPTYWTVVYAASPIIPNTPYLWAWNVPSENCPRNYTVPIDLSFYPFVGYPRENATGQNVTLFYCNRLGRYPYIHMRTNQVLNGGIPQSGNLTAHLEKARKDIAFYIPNDQVSLAVIDWEEWRPLWIRNWGPKTIYRNKSIELVMKNNPSLDLTTATKKAKTEFETAAKDFMLKTLKLGKSLRPKSYWGYYLFPDCYNHQYKIKEYNGSCFDLEKTRNNELLWLWNESTALYPSIYLNTKLKSNPQAALFVRNRVQEAFRVSKLRNVETRLPVFVYVRPEFTDAPGEFLSEVDLVNTIGESIALGASGIIIWQSFNISKSEQSCQNLSNYMNTVLNPYLLNVTLTAKLCSQVLCQDQGICIRKNWNSSDYLHLNPENFRIGIGNFSNFEVHKNATVPDMEEFATKFECICYSNMNYRNSSKQSIDYIHICVGNVCISSLPEPVG